MQVSPTPSEIIRDLLPPKELRSVQIDGTHHDLFAEGRFEDWHRRFVAAAKKSGSLFHNGLIEFFQVMSEDDLDRFDRDLGGIENFDGAHEWLFRGGFYDRVEALPGWESQKRDLLRLEEEPPPEVRPSRPGIIQFLPSPLEWPYLPSTVNPPSPFLEWPSLPFPVNPIAALPTANPPVRHLDVSRGDRLSLCAAFSKHGMVGNSLPLVRLYSEAAHICESIKRYPNERPNLLITGSPGSGKELLAKAVSAMAGRPKDLFRAINCGAIPDQLVESELFGVVPGYPGFHDKAGRKGLFQEANNGTVQLDEIGRASDKLQTLLLRVLQE